MPAFLYSLLAWYLPYIHAGYALNILPYSVYGNITNNSNARGWGIEQISHRGTALVAIIGHNN